MSEQSEPHDPLDGLPRYQVARLIVEFFASVDEYLGEVFPGRLAEANLFLVVARASLPDWLDGDHLRPPATGIGRIRVYGAANSLTRSPETLRRYARWLIEAGWLADTPTGVAVATNASNAPRVLRLYAKLHDLLARFDADIEQARDNPPTGRRRPVGVATRLRHVMESLLFSLEPGSLVPADPISDSIWCAVQALNMRSVTYDLELARRYGREPVPDTLREPVSLRFVSQMLGIPYATVWRKADALHRQGLIVSTGGGWLVPGGILALDAVATSFQRIAEAFIRKLRERAGSNRRPAVRYLQQRAAPAGAATAAARASHDTGERRRE